MPETVAERAGLIAERMASCAWDYRIIVELGEVHEMEGSFVIKTYHRDHPDEVNAYDFHFVEPVTVGPNRRPLVCLEGGVNNNMGWVMEAVPALMFAAIYAGNF